MKTIQSKIEEILKENGFIMLNNNSTYPSICDYGGGWEEYVKLIEEKKGFSSILIDNKTTLLSPTLYYALKESRKGEELENNEERLMEFIESNQPVSMNVVKMCVFMDKIEIKKTVKSLQKKFMITVLREGMRLNKNWGTYLWGTSKKWEEIHENLYGEIEKKDYRKVIDKMLKGKVSERFLNSLYTRD
ncbi:hypothetical protein [Sporosalibacterium faouarense]|uniref:hypothetical protein n=1 Tax=Sporosalibacterium faouarense TaxID=516123 RepID=UPI00192C9521|nr:hypothetical protein [Sporosalibacterium faouarense]